MARQYDYPGSVREAKNYRCYHCGTVFTTPQGICGHLHSKHGVVTTEIQHGIDWGVTGKVACDSTPMPVAMR